MIVQYFGGSVPAPTGYNQDDKYLIDKVNSLREAVDKLMADQRVDEAIRQIFAVLGDANKYIDITTPWILSKTDEGKVRLQTVLYVLQETIRVATVLLKSFLVELPDKVLDQLQVSSELRTYSSAVFMDNNHGRVLTKGEAIFPRLNVAEELKVLDTQSAPVEPKPELKHKPNIAFDDFEKLEIRVGKVLACEKVEKADKLLKSTIQFGPETRTIVSGIAKHYQPQDMVGKKVLVVTNLEPRTIRGIESRGMVLCALTDDDSVLKVTTIDGDIADGSEVG